MELRRRFLNSLNPRSRTQIYLLPMGTGACVMEVLGSPSFTAVCLFVALSLFPVGLKSLFPGVRIPGICRRRKMPVRVYMDGCFDMMHYGHCNALRQARTLGDQLVVGVVSDDEIKANKGSPVTQLHESHDIDFYDAEEEDISEGNAPFIKIQKKYEDILIFHIVEIFDDNDYIIHGDDPCLLPDGTDAYALAKKAGRYKQIKRTGVSSTDVVGKNPSVAKLDNFSEEVYSQG
ncbi:ethanolamine-phosphate cytidylyltransferase-like [Curcuma longa]|uniref:ethanolamine-phosphate cytidylyltransferase-like n=1 Tax=Curcuma longa TaxID=136217 RepID=UPI003D9ECF7F